MLTGIKIESQCNAFTCKAFVEVIRLTNCTLITLHVGAAGASDHTPQGSQHTGDDTTLHTDQNYFTPLTSPSDLSREH